MSGCFSCSGSNGGGGGETIVIDNNIPVLECTDAVEGTIESVPVKIVCSDCQAPVPVQTCPDNPLEVILVEDQTDQITTDIEYVCNTDTGVFDAIETIFTNGVQTGQTTTATTISCVPVPAPVVEVDVEYVCNETTDVYDLITTTITDGVSDGGVVTPTTIACDQPVPIIDVEVDYVCNETTGFYDLITTTITDGVSDGGITTTTSLVCAVPQVDYEQVRECRDGTIHIVTNLISQDNVITEISAVDTLEKCEFADLVPIDVCYETTCTALVSSNNFTTAPDTPEDLTGFLLALDKFGGTQEVLIDDPVTVYTWRDYIEGGRIQQLLAGISYPFEFSYNYVVDDGENTQINVVISICDPDSEGIQVQFAGGDNTGTGGTAELTLKNEGTLVVCLDSDKQKIAETLLSETGEVVTDYVITECIDDPTLPPPITTEACVQWTEILPGEFWQYDPLIEFNNLTGDPHTNPLDNITLTITLTDGTIYTYSQDVNATAAWVTEENIATLLTNAFNASPTLTPVFNVAGWGEVYDPVGEPEYLGYNLVLDPIAGVSSIVWNFDGEVRSAPAGQTPSQNGNTEVSVIIGQGTRYVTCIGGMVVEEKLVNNIGEIVTDYDSFVECVEEPVQQIPICKCYDPCYYGFEASLGRPNNAVSWQYGNVFGATYGEFSEAMQEAGFTEWIAGPTNEAHYFCPWVEGAEFFVDGVSQGIPAQVINPNAPDPTDAVCVKGCNDDRRDDLLEEIADPADPPIEECFTTVIPAVAIAGNPQTLAAGGRYTIFVTEPGFQLNGVDIPCGTTLKLPDCCDCVLETDLTFTAPFDVVVIEEVSTTQVVGSVTGTVKGDVKQVKQIKSEIVFEPSKAILSLQNYTIQQKTLTIQKDATVLDTISLDPGAVAKKEYTVLKGETLRVIDSKTVLVESTQTFDNAVIKKTEEKKVG